MLEQEYLLNMSKKDTCTSCNEIIQRSDMRFKMGIEGVLKCSRCAATDATLIRRSLLMSVVVGTLLTLINQGNLIFTGIPDSSLAWKIPLTYLVPFLVSWTSVLSASNVMLSEGATRRE